METGVKGRAKGNARRRRDDARAVAPRPTSQTRLPHAVDVHVGIEVRRLRRRMGFSQTLLAESLGLTFQQVQKYERGSNRISASKLLEIGVFLGVPVAYFFNGLPGQDVIGSTAQPVTANRAAKVDALALKIAQLGRQRQRLVARLVDELASEDGSEADVVPPLEEPQASDG